MSRPLRNSAILSRTELEPISTAAKTGMSVRRAWRKKPSGVHSMAACEQDYGNQAGWLPPILRRNTLTHERRALPPAEGNLRDRERISQPPRRAPASHATRPGCPARISFSPQTVSVRLLRLQAPPGIE